MKKILIVTLCAVLFNLDVLAQYKYKDIKNQYNRKDYVRQPGDMYNPALGGIASFLIPGLGQMIQGEGGRGAGFLVGTVALVTIAVVTAPTVDSNGNTIEEGSPGVSAVAFLGAAGVGIWSIVDAVRVAKVKNLAYRDKPLSRTTLNIEPHIGSMQTVDGIKSNAGLKLSLKF